ncbi:radical SAM family heme chaperone HemW [Streptomyces acidiscabies]|uniref:Heme chaperone HemW n=1 Tax=Streptomyces acidiscabies TaxID=42234 RepID=A0AAP6EEM4_9ACTN|nr:radical SAM family heme chaperone HemW [Streptomyces acidiscabies]MBP5939699.1 coproporphyrinogen III oxidase [Streptomyces sp. LBUM 1476]MBZ3910874.1 coproporphyrinogen III oxidase [Streptomyces acidiscabies]MDX2959346.1 radical SAM family heme chaperone HemW [Streptomyces acidiscabies]MDX3017510.1 radical SAM family heme chaperone HemW [Streptomyces acidiscabies]MDX3787986.1 radical SAM family heme chaperone HemW [Streptomyces acidiscabies]
MPSVLPDGEPVPDDGALPAAALAGGAERPLGFYLHVPYCATRCGYCDFNTYTATELRGTGGVLASRDNYADTLIDEIRLARKVLGDDPREVRTVFVGGGTPTLLAAGDLVRMLEAIREEFGLAEDAEVTTEANPETVDPAYLAALREGGFNRVSFGMQSARQHVLKVLDRTHTPGRPEACVREARAAGFEHVNLDLIYGTPGESDDDWRASLDAALGAGPDHVSAYALIVEEGTQLARRIRRGEVPMTDDDVHADRYLITESVLSGAGFEWYEVSNWATSEAARCLHNELYWRGADWWGAGPGAHSHVGGVRWWNVKHPGAYAAALSAGKSPGAGRELLSEEDRRVERILLELRLREGVPLTLLREAGLAAAGRVLGEGLLERGAYEAGRAVLTLRGRLLADAVVRDLVD